MWCVWSNTLNEKDNEEWMYAVATSCCISDEPTVDFVVSVWRLTVPKRVLLIFWLVVRSLVGGDPGTLPSSDAAGIQAVDESAHSMTNN